MKLGLVGPSYQERSLAFDAQRTLNLFPVLDETQQGKEISALYGTPGLKLFATAGNGPIRGSFASVEDGGFVVSGNTLYKVNSDGSTTSMGVLNSITSICTLEENGQQLFICDGADLYVLTYATNAFVKVTAAGFPGGGTTCFIDGYTVVNKPNSGQFNISALYDATSWNALDFATAESSPDNLVRVASAVGQLWLLGDKTTEIWSNNGDTNFPFARIAGAKMDIGCASAQSVCLLDNSLFWVSKDKDGTMMVHRTKGFTPMRISTYAIEYKLSQVADPTQLRGYTYQENGHLFYVVTGTGMSTTFVYDVSTQQWHERAYLNAFGQLETHRAVTHMFIYNKHLVGDKSTGNIYDQSLDYFDDNGDQIKRQRIFTHIHNEGEPLRINQVMVEFEGGVGVQSGQGSNPQVWLEVSEDFGRTYGPEYYSTIGALGQYRTRAVWRKLGYAYQFTIRLTISDPVHVAICGAYAK